MQHNAALSETNSTEYMHAVFPFDYTQSLHYTYYVYNTNYAQLKALCPETWEKNIAQTYSDSLGDVVVEDCLNFQLLSTDSRIRQPEINEEVLLHNCFEWIGHTDTLKMRGETKDETEERGGKGHDLEIRVAKGILTMSS